MKIIVLSDTHGNIHDAVEVINSCRIGCDLVVHLGDTLRDFEYIKSEFPDLAFVGVAGNNDYFSAFNNNAQRECLLDLDGIRTLICHGHEYGVKRSCDRILEEAQTKKASLVLFGHTHNQEKETVKEITLFNPGTMRLGEFGIIHIVNGIIASADLLTLGRLKGRYL